ncbi:MAG TPA: methylated-DNA--[protein]-cysteine S-methyltransferase [Dehalococcoidia bacterium]|nr:methylated-DNA--[protein]-cysteine S-methyltransferase [Dehalococcoidia bacterium]
MTTRLNPAADRMQPIRFDLPAWSSSARAFLDTSPSPAGPLAFAVNGDGALLRTQFLEGRYPTTIEQELARAGFGVTRDPERTAPVRQQLAEYAEGRRTAFDLPLVLDGDGWQQAVWRVLLAVPFGETRSYGRVAALAGRPGAAREVGEAVAANPLPLVVPCHRVIGADGSLKGFTGGVHLKRRLLAHEGARPALAI